MERAEKMYLVPAREINRLKSTATSSPTLRHTTLQRLDDEISDILRRTDLPDDVKIKRYTEILQRTLLHAKREGTELSRLNLVIAPDAEQSAAPAAEIESRTSTPAIVDHLNPRFRKNAAILLNTFSRHKDVAAWNEKGEFVYKGSVVPGSHLLDLVRNSVQSHGLTRKNTPHGWDVFMSAMAELNVPSSVIGHHTTRDALNDLKRALSSPSNPFEKIAQGLVSSTPSTRGSLLPKQRISPLSPSAWLSL